MLQSYPFPRFRLVHSALILLCVCLHAVGEPTPIDDSIVLRIGPLKVPQYVVDKRFSRFQETLEAEDGAASGITSLWFEDFLVNQVLTAKAISEGYATHPDVIALVDRMERHMLASIEGPYYQLILKAIHRSDDEIRSIYDQDPEANGHVPFADYSRMLYLKERDQAMLQHRNEVLQTVQFSIDGGNCGKLLERLVGLPLVPADLPAGFWADKADIPLAKYTQNGVSQSTTVSEWIEYFNHLFIRSIPTSDMELKRSIEDMIVAEADIRAARALGLDKERKFVQDRKHFLNAQALDRFEREKLIPEIKLPEGAVEAYYRQHQQAFRQPIAARGLLLQFKDQDTAMRWLQSNHLNERQDELATSFEEAEVTMEHPIPALAALTRLILWSPEGRAIGPVPVEDSAVVFLKQTSVTEPTPLSKVTGYITEQLTRDCLHDLEKELAPEYCKAFEVVDNISYEDYGVKTVKTPWGD